MSDINEQCKRIAELMEENEHLRSVISDDADNARLIMHESDVVRDENAKLRKLVLLLRACNEYCGMCNHCPLMQHDPDSDGGWCGARDEIAALERELGITVDKR